MLSRAAVVAAAIAIGLISPATITLRGAGTTYYVSPLGADTNPGTVTQPFATIQRAANVVAPGDTVIVEDGNYRGTGTGTPCASSGNRPVVCVSRGGSSTGWVTFRSNTRLGAKIDGASNASTYGFQFINDVGYIRVEGFDVFGMGSTSHDVAGFVIYDGGHDVVISHNSIHDIGRLCTDHIYGMSGVYVQNARVNVSENRIHDIGRFAPGENGCSPTTGNYQNHDHGLYINGSNDGWAPGARDITIFNNIVWSIARGWPVQVYPGAVANLAILHNTFAFANPYRAGHVLIAAPTSNGKIINNIFLDPLTAAINFSSGTQTNLTVNNNVSSTPVRNKTPAGVTFSNNLESVDPQLIAGDLIPQSTSPAIDAGLVLAEVSSDFVGTARPQGHSSDAGAWEAAAPSEPVMVAITAPVDGAIVRSRMTIKATATSPEGIASVRFYVDGVLTVTDTAAPYSALFRPNRYTVGEHVLSVTATDTRGNRANDSVTITVTR